MSKKYLSLIIDCDHLATGSAANQAINVPWATILFSDYVLAAFRSHPYLM